MDKIEQTEQTLPQKIGGQLRAIRESRMVNGRKMSAYYVKQNAPLHSDIVTAIETGCKYYAMESLDRYLTCINCTLQVIDNETIEK